MLRAEARSSALARAQAQLAGRRVASKVRVGDPWDVALKNRSSPRFPHFPSDLSDLSSSSSSSSTQAGRIEPDGETHEETPSRQPHRTFLKQKPGSHASQKSNATTTWQARLGPASQARSYTVLKKLEQIESKIRSRKGRLDTESKRMSEEEFSFSKSSQSPELTAGDTRYLTGNVRRKENVRPTNKAPDSKTEDGRRLLESPRKDEKQGDEFRFVGKSFLKSQIKPLPQIPSPPSLRSSRPSRNARKRPPHRTPSPPSSNTPRLSKLISRTSSPSTRDSRARTTTPEAGSSHPSERSQFEHSIIHSLDELFSGVAETHSASESSDFRINIVSLDELAPTITYQEDELKGEASAKPEGGRLHKEEEPIPLSAAPQSPFKAPNATAEKAITLEPEADLGDTEISEQLSNSSAKWSACKQASPASAQYSEDFVSEDSEGSEANSFAEESLDGSEASLTSRRSDSSPGSFRQAPVQSANPVGTRKEAAVQTSPSSFAYHGLETGGAATLGWSGETSSIKMAHIPHIVNLDALEASATYNPVRRVLDDLLRQNLQLIRQFVEAARHLHSSWVASLEAEEFHYHTLQEAKMYMERKKPPSLTMEQAL